MSATSLSTVTSNLIGSYGNTAKNLIDAYQAGGERFVSVLEQRWNAALKESRPQLTAEVTKNASAAQLAFSVLYSKGLNQSARGAQQLVSQIVRLAETGVERVAANAALFEQKSGVTPLSTLAQASAPSALLMSRLASQLEQKTAELAGKISGSNVATASIKRTTAFRQRRTQKAA